MKFDHAGKVQQVHPVAGMNVAARKKACREIIEANRTCGEAFFLTDLHDIWCKHRTWQAMLPRIEPFYAIKCNSDPVILKALAALNLGFDCASAKEIQAMLDLGVAPDRIIFANPCKALSHLLYAKEKGVKLMTFDNENELLKCAEHFPSARLVLRVLADDSKAVCRLGLKYGARPSCTLRLLQLARTLHLNVVGVSFHVGSGSTDASAFADAVYRARAVFDQALSLGFRPTLLDVGGGFPGTTYTSAISFDAIASCLTRAVDECFPPSCGVRVIAEPGRFYVASACCLAVSVIGKRTPHEVAGDHNNNNRRAIDTTGNGHGSSARCHDVPAAAPRVVGGCDAGDDRADAAHATPRASGMRDMDSSATSSGSSSDSDGEDEGDEDDSVLLGATGRGTTRVECTRADGSDGTILAAKARPGERHNKGRERAVSMRAPRQESPPSPTTPSLSASTSCPASRPCSPTRHYQQHQVQEQEQQHDSLEHDQDKQSLMLYVNDGVYGSFNCILFDHAVVRGEVLLSRCDVQRAPPLTCSIWGPTCDSMDCIEKRASLPELEVGDWLFYPDMGAYTSCAASTFNGFDKPMQFYTFSADASFDATQHLPASFPSFVFPLLGDSGGHHAVNDHHRHHDSTAAAEMNDCRLAVAADISA
ncbi:ornithine decarboxylase [Salpingoeca rosetta]|uniref:Ornithine decarboxylase n=1 Tax=Salpingoeca rosetta (strain ATCC 50818 / BSB-021) TaxID=946362 RepID=F2UT23_SALR5|nr:ornithine decarboxylase [Salpingoeca rosetta]EGD81282.1 ornithine decarboxylase [Salpingoeca rosetta]|eukprot:XP_004987678.1 ornithine decarboxylase [Salpingoeca rosetta]